MGAPVVGARLPRPLAEKIARGGWIRTAHRGFPRVALGNTLRSVTAAFDFGVDLVEVDLHRTQDGRLVLWHDSTVGTGSDRLVIAETCFESLRHLVQATASERLVDLGEAIRAANGRAGLMIDLKAEGLARDIVATVEAAGFGPVVVCGDYWESLRAIRSRAGDIGVSLTLDEGWHRSGPAIDEIDTAAVTISWTLASRGLIEAFHARGIAVLAWTVDDIDSMRKLLDLGVDGLTSNRCDLFPQI